MDKILVAMFDSDVLRRSGLRAMLEASAPDIQVVIEANVTWHALKELDVSPCCVAVIGAGRSRMNVARAIRRDKPGLPLLMLGAVGCIDPCDDFFQGWITESDNFAVFVDAIRRLNVGKRFLSHDVALSRNRRKSLTTRKRQIADLVLEGRTDQEIAARLNLGQATIKTHVLELYAHYGVNRRCDLLLKLMLEDHAGTLVGAE